MKQLIVIGLGLAGLLSLSGCMNITASLQPENTSVPAVREASDCVPIVFGLAYGRASIEGALATSVPTTESLKPYAKDAKAKATIQPITQIRRVQLHDIQVLMFGARCVEVVGE